MLSNLSIVIIETKRHDIICSFKLLPYLCSRFPSGESATNQLPPQKQHEHGHEDSRPNQQSANRRIMDGKHLPLGNNAQRDQSTGMHDTMDQHFVARLNRTTRHDGRMAINTNNIILTTKPIDHETAILPLPCLRQHHRENV